jgi:hypothetical protein
MNIRCLAPNFHELNSSISALARCDHDAMGAPQMRGPGRKPQRPATARNDVEPGQLSLPHASVSESKTKWRTRFDPDPDGGVVD